MNLDYKHNLRRAPAIHISEEWFEFFQKEFQAVKPARQIRSEILESWIYGEVVKPAKHPLVRREALTDELLSWAGLSTENQEFLDRLMVMVREHMTAR